MARASRQVNTTCSVLESLARFDTSKTQRLKIVRGRSPTSEYPYNAFLPMKHLQTLTLSQCVKPRTFISALHPDMGSSEAVVCPKLKELGLVLCADGEIFDIKRVIGMAAARASMGAKLESVRIVGQDTFVRTDVLELKKHVLRVECGPEGTNYGSDDGNKGD
jgi:hypothetical protein